MKVIFLCQTLANLLLDLLVVLIGESIDVRQLDVGKCS